MMVIADHELDALIYPHQRRLVVPIGEDQVERNGVLSNSTGFPAITFPGGFSEPGASAPLGVPVGIELLGPEWTEPTLIGLAYAFEQATSVRRPPEEHAAAPLAAVRPARSRRDLRSRIRGDGPPGEKEKADVKATAS